ncbi:MAG: LacI family DNA-binding transcriptional regulator [Caldilineaceae bacterium]
MNRNITMHDVARHAGVSQSTVSRVLNQSGSTVSISEETVHRVMAAVDELGYYPNQIARSLRGQKTNMLAMLVGDIANPFYHVMVRKVQEIARQHHYDLLIASSDHNRELEKNFVAGLIRRPVDGVFLVPYHVNDEEIGLLMRRTGASVVLLGQESNHPLVDTAYADDGRATYEAVHWLIQERRHERIAYIGVPNTHVGNRRSRAFLRAMEEADLPVPDSYLEAGDFSVDGGAKAMMHLLRLDTRPTAVVACNDLMALGAMLVANDQGLSIPGDVAVVGFDNIPESGRIRPRLTTIAQYPDEIGEKLANALFDRIEGRYDGPARHFEIPCRLIQRESA